jgi:hypothetical protein
MAQIAKVEAEKAADTAKNVTDNIAELGNHATNQAADMAHRGVQMVRKAAGTVGEVERVAARRSAEGTAELGRALVELVNAQTRHNLETLTALSQAVDWDQVAKAVDWDRVFQIQSAYLRVSLGRAAQLTRRYVEIFQAVTVSAADTAKRQASQAA